MIIFRILTMMLIFAQVSFAETESEWEKTEITWERVKRGYLNSEWCNRSLVNMGEGFVANSESDYEKSFATAKGCLYALARFMQFAKAQQIQNRINHKILTEETAQSHLQKLPYLVPVLEGPESLTQLMAMELRDFSSSSTDSQSQVARRASELKAQTDYERDLFHVQWLRKWKDMLAQRVAYISIEPILIHLENYYEVTSIDKETAARILNAQMEMTFGTHSGFVTRQSLDRLITETKQVFYGIGAGVLMKEGGVLITFVMEDGPAEKAGLKAGDIVTQIDGVLTRGMNIDEAISLLKDTAAGTTVQVQIQGRSKPVSVVREKVVFSPYIKKTIDNTQGRWGYLRLISFYKGASEDVEKEFKRFQSDGAKGFVLDLRDNPGGALEEAVKIADLFLPRGKLVVETRPAFDDIEGNTATDFSFDIPLVILINGASASASELLAAPLAYYKKAVLVGERSFGKGSVQGATYLFDLANENEPLESDQRMIYNMEQTMLGVQSSTGLTLTDIFAKKSEETKSFNESATVGFKTTIAQFYQPGGTTHQGVGVDPHLEVPFRPGMENMSVRNASNVEVNPVGRGQLVVNKLEDVESSSEKSVSSCFQSQGTADQEFDETALSFRSDYQLLKGLDVLSCL